MIFTAIGKQLQHCNAALRFVLIPLTVFCLFPDVVDSRFTKQVDILPDIVDSISGFVHKSAQGTVTFVTALYFNHASAGQALLRQLKGCEIGDSALYTIIIRWKADGWEEKCGKSWIKKK